MLRTGIGGRFIQYFATEDAALQALDEFGQKWDDKYPQISKSWLANWANLNTFLTYPMDIRKAIYTTNTIELLSSISAMRLRKEKSSRLMIR